MRRTQLRRLSDRRQRQMGERRRLLAILKAMVGHRCEFCGKAKPLDGHETLKPRSRYWLNPEYVCMLCRRCHERCETSYQDGRLEIPGTRSSGWGFQVVFAANKFARRAP